MKNRVAVLGVSGARDFGKALHERLRLSHHKFRDDLVMQAVKELAIAEQVTGIEKRDGKFHICGIKPVALGEGARRRADLHSKVSNFLRKAPNGVAVGRFGVTVGMQEKNVDVGVREEPSTPESAQCHERKPRWSVFLGRNDFVPQLLKDTLDETRALFEGRPPIASTRERLLNPV